MYKVLLTGGTGFIGSHVCLVLLSKGYKVIVLDSCINSTSKSIKYVKKILRENPKFNSKNLEFIEGDINDKNKLTKIFNDSLKEDSKISGVIHLAGLKSVNDSIETPIDYWKSNVMGSINLLEIMDIYDCNKIIFSSSATIYGLNNNNVLVKESNKIDPINPYGSNKAAIERLLKDIYESDKKKWNIINLRYFNPIGAHNSGLIGECPNKSPNNIFPLILDVAIGKLQEFQIFGNDWDTEDGTCIRDYIHVMDVAEAHVKAFEKLFEKKSKFLSLNIGTGKGTSVLELINIFSQVNNVNIKYTFYPRREGDAPNVVACNEKAVKYLDWTPRRNISEMCKDGWGWKVLNPNGYL